MCAENAIPAPQATRQVYLDDGVVYWADTKKEVSLFGANYCLPSACDYRAAGYVANNRKKLIDQDMTHFARMGWNGLRVTFWGDWENTDKNGNLLENEHLDLLDYLIAKARERNIYMLLSPIVTYSSQWPDAMQAPSPGGISTHFAKAELGTSQEAIQAQRNYLRQLLIHVNPYTNVAIKDEPAVLFIEMINEPWHHSGDVSGSVQYVNALVDAVRSTGCDKILFHNLSQDFGMITPLEQSTVQGVSFAWYPTGLVAGRTIRGNVLRTVDDYPPMRRRKLKRFAKLVYEFDQPDAMSATLYPAMVRTFRSVGAQFAAIFSYDMLATAPHNLGWQTHFLNLVYTPQKAVSAVIAGEAMRRLPRMQQYGNYPQNKEFGDLRLDDERDVSELVAADVFMHAGDTRSEPEHPEQLTRIVGYGSSPLVEYRGRGAYFLDKIRAGQWRLEAYPDAIQVRDPYERPSPNKVVVQLIYRESPMQVRLPDLNESFTVTPISNSGAKPYAAEDGRFMVKPGVYLLSTMVPIETSQLPEWVAGVRFDEYVVPDEPSVNLELVHHPQVEVVAGEPIAIQATIVDARPPEEVAVFVRPVGGAGFVKHEMHSTDGYDFVATLADDALRPGVYEYCIAVRTGSGTTTFPARISSVPTDWDFYGKEFFTLKVVKPTSPLVLLAPERDFRQIDFTRIDSHYKHGVSRLETSDRRRTSILGIEAPVTDGGLPEDYTASLYVGDRIRSRAGTAKAKTVKLSARGIGECRRLIISLVDHAAHSWSASVALTDSWQDLKIPLDTFKPARTVLLPLAFPGRWAYWGPDARKGEHTLQIEAVERLQLSLRDSPNDLDDDEPYGFQFEYVVLEFMQK